jgi:hypothetical protein
MTICLTNQPERQKSVTRIAAMTVINSVTPKVAAKHDLLFNKTASEPVGVLF